jgi:hypothetical protein
MDSPNLTSETRTEHPARLSIDGGAQIDAALFIYTRTTWLPGVFPSTDPGWEFTDGAGHWHGFTEDRGLLPTLDRDGEVTWCRGRCDQPGCPGWHPPAYTCKICAEVVTPRFGPMLAEATAIPTVGRWVVAAEFTLTPDPVRVQARLWLPDGTVLIGTAKTTGARGQLIGEGELATRGAAGLRPVTFHQVSHPA